MRHGRPKLGQHFLRDERFADMAVAAAKLTADDVVLEVGPGKGVLTRRLVATGARVVAVELDAELADGLRSVLSPTPVGDADGLRSVLSPTPVGDADALDVPGVTLVRGDAVQVELPPFTACVSNLPYQISSPFLFRLLEREFRVAVLLLQKEFADRLVAKPGGGDYGRLSVNAQRRADVRILARVPPGAFAPPPRVDSALVEIVPRPPAFDVPPNYERVVEKAFAQRRKKISNTLGSKTIPHADRRPEELTPEEFADVARALEK